MCCDYDPPSVYNETTPKARKEHRCNECRRSISVGETYKRVEGRWEGGWSTFRICEHCLKCIKIHGQIDADCDCYGLGDFWESFHEHIEGSYSTEGSKFHRLEISANHKWRYRRGSRAGQLMPVPNPAEYTRKLSPVETD